MSLVYNNDKLIGKCSKYAIEKVQGTSPFVMLENFEPKQPQLNENQQMVLEWLKEEQTKNPELTIFGTLSVLFDESENRFMNLDVIDALNDLSNPQQEGVFQAFSKWSLEQEAE
ncbi:hypothetical protein [Enterococcus gallinarum]|uniref:hypothetical protein n=1 Tax=Enterococcus gallinarum TaxID=1353 RepID=UPI003D6C04BC